MKYFCLTTMRVILKIKILLLRNKKYLHLIHIYYLFACNRSLFISYYYFVSLLLLLEKLFDYLYILWKKCSCEINMRNKCVTRKINLFFWRREKCQIIPSEIGHFEHDHRFLFNRELGSIRSFKDVRQDSICFGIFRIE